MCVDKDGTLDYLEISTDIAMDSDVLQEALTTKRLIVQRLNQIVLEQTPCTCPCHTRDHDREAYIIELKSRIRLLDAGLTEKDEELEALSNQVRGFKATLDKVMGQDNQPPEPTDVTAEVTLATKGTNAVNETPPVLFAYHASIELDYSASGVGDNLIAKDEKDKTDVSKVRTISELSDIHSEDTPRQSLDTATSDTKFSEDRGQPERNPSIYHKSVTFQSEGQYDDKTSEPGSATGNTGSVSGEHDNVYNSFKTATCTNELTDTEPGTMDTGGPGPSNSPSPTTNISNREAKQKQATKPNFQKQSLSESLGVRVEEQTEKRTLDTFLDWHMAGNKEEEDARESGLATLKGIYTVVCVDISYSMTKGQAWQQTRTFFMDFIESLQRSVRIYNVDRESVALVTFGHKTEVLKRLTKDFTSLQMAFDGISLGGPSPLYGGLLLAVAAANTPLAAGGATVNDIPVLPKFVIITDGHPTDTCLVAGPDEPTVTERDETNIQIQDTMKEMEDCFDVYCVPVGNADMDFMHLMASLSDGKLLTYRDGKKVGSRLRKTLIAGSLRTTLGVGTSGSDEEDIKEIFEAVERRTKRMHYTEIETSNLPQIGSRVRRGPDWKYSDQDANGPGTVIGHARNDGQVWVEWDNNNIVQIYRYSARGDAVDVLLVDEPRLTDDHGRLKVGCIVQPCIDWQQTTRNVKVTDKGVVLKLLSDDRVQVRWPNKERGEYSYGLSGKFEVEFCPPKEFHPNDNQDYVSNYQGSQGYTPSVSTSTLPRTTTVQPNKNKNVVNKNKNVKNKNA